MPIDGKFDTFSGMDTEHLRTFLEVAHTRHFGKAAENLFVTQSAVSARIKLLESTLGTELFTRERNNLQLTAQGMRLLAHAEIIVGAWARARQETGLDQNYNDVLTIGGLVDLWSHILYKWLSELPGAMPGVVITAEAHASDVLVRRLLDGLVDLAILFEPPQLPAVAIRQIGEIELALVASRAHLSVEQAVSDGYIMIDWGTAYSHEHARYFPDIPTPSMRVSLGSIGYSVLKRHGGAAYLPLSLISDDVKRKKLYIIDEAPVFQRPVYALYASDSGRTELIETALSLLDSYSE